MRFRHLSTYGSKDGIHPPRVLNKKTAVATMGQAEHPYGLGFPEGVAVDLKGRVWISDSATHSVHVFDPTSGAYREFRRAGDYTLEQPSGITCDAAGRIYLVDTALANVFVFEDGEYARRLVQPGQKTLAAPTVIALSENGRTLYVADPPRNVIVAMNREGDVDETIALTPTAREPAGITVINNQLYVLGGREHRIEIFSPSGERRADMRWDSINAPLAFAYDAANHRYLVGNPRIMSVEVFDEEYRGVGVFGRNGDAVDQQRRIDRIYVDQQGRVYVVDGHHGKVLVFGEWK